MSDGCVMSLSTSVFCSIWGRQWWWGMFPHSTLFSVASCHSTIDLCLSVLGPLPVRCALGIISVLLKPQLGLDL